MDIYTIILLAIGLAMDAFAVSVCKGLAMPSAALGKCAIIGLWFGTFQWVMPIMGYILGTQFKTYISSAAPWIAFIVLAMIGIDMIREAIRDDEEEETDSLAIKDMFLLSIATSIDAFVVGITFVCVPVTIVEAGVYVNTAIACAMIALVTFLVSVLGVKMGHVFGVRYKNKAELAGGGILVFLGVKTLVEHIFYY